MAMTEDPEFDALADALAELADARGARAAIIVMLTDDDDGDLARGSGCTCDTCLGRLVHVLCAGFGDSVERHGGDPASGAEVCH